MFPRRFGLLGVVGGLLLVLVAGGIGFAIGAATNGAPGVHYGYWPAWGFGFGFFGLLFPLLFFFLIFALIRGAVRGWDGYDGRWGRGRYYGRPWQGDVPPAVEEWHRRLHGESGTNGGTGSSGTGSGEPGRGFTGTGFTGTGSGQPGSAFPSSGDSGPTPPRS